MVLSTAWTIYRINLKICPHFLSFFLQFTYHRDFLHKIWFNDFNTSLVLSLIKISTLKIVQLLRYSQGNTQSIFYVIISNLFFLFPQ